MATYTTRIRPSWAARAAREAGGVTAWSRALGIDKGTASRQLRGGAKASPDLIGAVLTRYPVKFEAAFEVVPADYLDVAEARAASALAAATGQGVA